MNDTPRGIYRLKILLPLIFTVIIYFHYFLLGKGVYHPEKLKTISGRLQSEISQGGTQSWGGGGENSLNFWYRHLACDKCIIDPTLFHVIKRGNQKDLQ